MEPQSSVLANPEWWQVILLGLGMVLTGGGWVREHYMRIRDAKQRTVDKALLTQRKKECDEVEVMLRLIPLVAELQGYGKVGWFERGRGRFANRAMPSGPAIDDYRQHYERLIDLCTQYIGIFVSEVHAGIRDKVRHIVETSGHIDPEFYASLRDEIQAAITLNRNKMTPEEIVAELSKN